MRRKPYKFGYDMDMMDDSYDVYITNSYGAMLVSDMFDERVIGEVTKYKDMLEEYRIDDSMLEYNFVKAHGMITKYEILIQGVPLFSAILEDKAPLYKVIKIDDFLDELDKIIASGTIAFYRLDDGLEKAIESNKIKYIMDKDYRVKELHITGDSSVHRTATEDGCIKLVDGKWYSISPSDSFDESRVSNRLNSIVEWVSLDYILKDVRCIEKYSGGDSEAIKIFFNDNVMDFFEYDPFSPEEEYELAFRNGIRIGSSSGMDYAYMLSSELKDLVFTEMDGISLDMLSNEIVSFSCGKLYFDLVNHNGRLSKISLNKDQSCTSMFN